MKQTFPLSRHTTLETYLYDGQYDKREVLFDPDSAEVTNLKRIALIDFDVRALKGRRITGGWVSMKALLPDVPVEIGVSTVSDDWDPRFASNYVRKEKTPWAGDLWATDVIMGNGGSVYGRVKTQFDPATSILRFEVPAKVLYRMACGQSFGIALVDCRSRSYAPLDAEHLWCGANIHKVFGMTDKCGFAPVLEVESEPMEHGAAPAPATDFAAEGWEEPERADSGSVALRWSVPKEGPAPFLSYEIRVAELAGRDSASLSLADLRPVERWQTPNFDPAATEGRAKVAFLRPDTDYAFALVVTDGVASSEPVWATARTKSPRKPVEVGDVRLPGKPEAGLLEAAGFRVGVLPEFAASDPVRPCLDSATASRRAKALLSAGETAGFQIVVENLGGAPASYTAKVVRCEGVKATVARGWYLKAGGRWVPEVVAPLAEGGAFAIPAADNGVEGQRAQMLYVEAMAPADARPGACGFAVAVSDGRGTVEVPFDIEVSAVKRGDSGFRVELNGYVSLAKCAGYEKDGDPEGALAETEYYRLAAANGMECNILPYFHTGIVQEGFAPVLGWKDGVPTVVDWGPWDRHFEKYFTGAYLEGTDTPAAPISHIYLPFHENWPMPIREYDTVKVDLTSDDYPENINQHKLRAPSMEEHFRPGYREGIKAILKEFIRHADEKGWGGVEFQYFFNNKHFYKRKGFVDRCKDRRTLEFWLCEPTCGNDGLGTSWWLLDEPNFMDDWDAIRYYGSILREAQAETGSGKNFSFRVDISCFNHMFDSLDGLLDLGVVASMFYNPREATMRERKTTLGERHWMYGSWNSIGTDNLETTLWFLDAYLRGAEGIIPWYNYALDWNYEQADTCAALYPGRRFGSLAPLPSLRLKAGRLAVELVRYLETFRRRNGYSGWQLRTYVTGVLGKLGLVLDGTTVRTSAVDAGTVRYGTEGVSVAEALQTLKEDVVRRLEGGL